MSNEREITMESGGEKEVFIEKLVYSFFKINYIFLKEIFFK